MGADADHPRPRGGRRPRRPARDHAPRPGGRGGADRARCCARCATPTPARSSPPRRTARRGCRGWRGRRCSRSRAWCATTRSARRGLFGPPRGVPRGARRQLHAARRARASASSARAGCGKSTLTRAVLGLEALQGGASGSRARRCGPASGCRGALRAKMQVVFQDPYGSFNPRHRVARLVAEPFHLLDDPPRGAARRAAVDDGARPTSGSRRRTRTSTSTSSPAASASASPSPGR